MRRANEWVTRNAALAQLLTLLSLVLGVLLGLLLIRALTPAPAQPKPIVIVCTWGHGCQETNEVPRG